MNEPKPGWRSSEFWLNLAGFCVVSWCTYEFLTTDMAVERYATAVGVLVGFCGWYQSGRTNLKTIAGMKNDRAG